MVPELDVGRVVEAVVDLVVGVDLAVSIGEATESIGPGSTMTVGALDDEKGVAMAIAADAVLPARGVCAPLV